MTPHSKIVNPKVTYHFMDAVFTHPGVVTQGSTTIYIKVNILTMTHHFYNTLRDHYLLSHITHTYTELSLQTFLAQVTLAGDAVTLLGLGKLMIALDSSESDVGLDTPVKT